MQAGTQKLKKGLALALLCVAASLRLNAANGDINSIRINSDGWSAYVEVLGYNTNSTYSFGLVTVTNITRLTDGTIYSNIFDIPGPNTPYFTVLTPGFDNTGTSNWTSMIVYATKQVRFAYPSNAFADQSLSGSSVTNRIALSDFIGPNDTVTATFPASWYSNSAAASGVSVVNGSLQPYAKVIANWTWPGYNRETNTNLRLRAVGFHPAANNGRPLACMKFIASQTNGTPITNVVTDMTIDRTLPDLFWTGEYISDFALSQFTNGASIRCNLIGLPWRGTATECLITTDALVPTVLPATITNLCDKNISLVNYIAVIDPAGSDANGRATNVAPASVNSAHYFATLRGATVAVFGTNNNFGGRIYTRTGLTNFAGGSGNITTVPSSWLEVIAYPGDTQTGYTTAVGPGFLGHICKMTGQKFTAGNLFFNGNVLWWNQCDVDTTATAIMQLTKCWYLTYNNITTFSQGIRPFGAGDCNPGIVRGNNVKTNCALYCGYTVMGNIMTNNQTGAIIGDISSQLGPSPQYSIVYNNYFSQRAGADFTGINSIGISNGCAIIQNVWEHYTNTVSGGSWDLASNTGQQCTNVMLWYNTVVGQRTTTFYNDNTANNPYRYQFSSHNNLFDDWNIKTDVYVTQNNARTNNWPCIWAVNWTGNIFAESTNIGTAAGQFLNAAAMQGYQGLSSSEWPNQTPRLFLQFVNRCSWDGVTNAPPGYGNYAPLSTAFQLGIVRRALIPFDLYGNNRSGASIPNQNAFGWDASGAITCAPRKGDFIGL
jgi:hypothetical protein